MKKSIIIVLIVAAILLTSCTQIQQCLGQPASCNVSDGGVADGNDLTGGVTDAQSESDDAVLTYEELVKRALENADSSITEDTTTEDTSSNEEVEGPSEEDTFSGFATLRYVEGDLIELDVVATDPDGDEVTYEYASPIDENGRWQTQDGDVGTYIVEVTASDGLLSTTEEIRLIIAASNKGPVIDCPSSFTVSEGEEIDLPCTIFDREGDEVTYTVGGDLMNDFVYQTDYADAGEYEVVITATDGNRETTHIVAVTIENTNRAPTFSEPEEVVVQEGEDVTIPLAVDDPDGDMLLLVFPSPFNEQGVWETQKGDAGTYTYDVELTDGETTVVIPVSVVVTERNDPPVIQSISPITVKEGELITLSIEVDDEDVDSLDIEISGFMTSETYQTDFDDAGEYEVTVTVSDGVHEVTTTVQITVENVNRPPVFVI